MRHSFAMTMLTTVFLIGCDFWKKAQPDVAVTAGRDLEVLRAQKDAYFLSENSPLDEARRFEFKGLDYFAEDSSFRFPVRLIRNSNPIHLDMVTSKGTSKSYVAYGYVEFQLSGTQRLTVYKPDPPIVGHEGHLFIPFKDLTNGQETYPSGRYLDIIESSTDSDWFSLDFNLAYNPWCAYSKNYNCPYPPQANHLKVRVLAGERWQETR